MLLLAFRNVFQGKGRLLMSTGGLALALLLVLTLDAIFTGADTQVSAYIEHAGADVWVSQAGVRNMHMSSSTIPLSLTGRVGAVPGVASTTPILYLTSAVDTQRGSHVAYIIGMPPDPAAGAPWKVVAGRRTPTAGEAVIDRAVANSAGVGLGSQVTILNHQFRVSGLTEGTLTIVNSIAFISITDFMRIRGSTTTVSYLLVKAKPGYSPDTVASSIERAVDGVTALSSAAFAGGERQALGSMTTDLVAVMNLVGLLIGLAVMALSAYTFTQARRAEYGILKAVGARNRDLYLAVLAQSAIGFVLGLAASLLLTLVLSVIVPVLKPGLDMEMSLASVVKVTFMGLVITAAAAVLPVRQMARFDPSAVFRRKVA